MILSEEVLPWLQDAWGAVDRAAAAIPTVRHPRLRCGNAVWARGAFGPESELFDLGLDLLHGSRGRQFPGWEDTAEGQAVLSNGLTTLVATFRALQDLQPLYLHSRKSASAERIEAQTQLIAALLRLEDALEHWTEMPLIDTGERPADDQQHFQVIPQSEWRAYLLTELSLAKQAGVLRPMSAKSAATP